jgi:hypothetical protein
MVLPKTCKIESDGTDVFVQKSKVCEGSSTAPLDAGAMLSPRQRLDGSHQVLRPPRQ